MTIDGAFDGLLGFAPSAAEDIRDIRGPVHIPTAFWGLVSATVAVGLLLLGYAAYVWFRRSRRRTTKSPGEIALERIEGTRPLAQDGRAAEVCDELSDAVREYIEARFEIHAARRTTEEFLRDLLANDASPVAAHRESLGEFLGACDLVKFARFSMSGEPLRKMIERADAFVRETAPPSRGARGQTGGPPHHAEVRP